MTVDELIAFRRRAGLTQTGLARAIGLGLRAYQDVEARGLEEDLSARHALAVERCSITLAVQRGNVDLALPSIRRDALDFVALLRGGPAA